MTPMAINKQNSYEKTIIDALKGLTFKIDIKITDVIASDKVSAAKTPSPRTSLDTASALSPAPAPVKAPAPPTPPAPALAPALHPGLAPSLDPAPVPDPVKATAPPTPPAPALARASAPAQASVRAPTPLQAPEPSATPAPSRAPEPASTPRVPEPAPTPRAPESPPAPAPIVRAPMTGSLRIGTQMRTICVAVDETVTPTIAYIAYDSQEIANITNAITDISSEIESDPEVTSVHVGDIVFAKSIEDNNWYRAIIEEIKEQVYIKVHYFDWGLGETLSIKRIRRLNRLELGLSKHPACAVRVRFVNETDQKLDDVLSCQVEFDMIVVSYDEATQIYSCKITG